MRSLLQAWGKRSRKTLVVLSAIGFLSSAHIVLAQDNSANSTAVKQTGERKVKSRVTPEYPDVARKMHISGTVRVEAVVEPDGKVRDTRILGGSPLLAQEVATAVKKWQYEEAPKETTETVEVTFQPAQ